jgi:hypothetical protein
MIRIRLLFAVCTMLPLVFGTARAVDKSGSVVKVTAAADKPGADGTQVITVTLEPKDAWHVYANPVGNPDLVDAQTTLTVTGKGKPEVVKIDYPAGKVIKDKVVGDYKVYEEKTSIKVTIKRAKGDTEKVEIGVKLQACNEKNCLAGEVVKVSVP